MAATPSDFVMQGSRQLLELAGGAVHLEQQVNAIERAVLDSPGLAPDLARTLVETVCKTILGDRGQECADLGFKDLLKATYSALQLVPDTKLEAEQTQAALRSLVDHLDDAIQSITDLRKAEGMASHGKDAYFASIELVQAQFVARAADALVTFLYQSHRTYFGAPLGRGVRFEDHEDLNDYIDASNSVVDIFELQYRPSEVLFQMDRQAYRDVLANFEQIEAEETGEAEVEAEASEATTS